MNVLVLRCCLRLKQYSSVAGTTPVLKGTSRTDTTIIFRHTCKLSSIPSTPRCKLYPRSSSTHYLWDDRHVLSSVNKLELTSLLYQIRNVNSASKDSTESTEQTQQFSQRPKAQTTINEEEVSKFSRLASLWWDEAGEFEPLHALNQLRIPLIRDALVANKPLNQYDDSKPLEGFWVADIGSGGGILSEPLARLGASVIGIEASEESIKAAEAHLVYDPAIREKVRYFNCTVEEIAESQAGKFDAVVASEVIEHVSDPSTFVACACRLVRPGGSIFFTTINKTRLSYILGIVAAEQILRIVPRGTHDWQKFVSPADLQSMLEKNNCNIRLIHGMCYNPLTKTWSWIKDCSINYAIHAVKSAAATEQTEVDWSDQSNQSAPSDKGRH